MLVLHIAVYNLSVCLLDYLNVVVNDLNEKLLCTACLWSRLLWCGVEDR